ncbi:universal stress protein [Streptomyces sp. NPDC005799]|uniref:universal stress protein n=1 Tax=Streptomyces sp. NPDC005799 TaxID=3154678 RepID=UPI0033CE6239
MGGASGGRVIVGVDDSPMGLRALHAAVAQARGLGRELIAVRAYPAPSGGPAWQSPPDWRLSRLPQPSTSEPWHQLLADCEQRELGTVTRIFEQAMGGLPRDVCVHPVASMGAPGPVLVAAAYRDDDLLVVGRSPARRLRRLRPWRWFRRSTCGYCARHASCQVLTIPLSELARWTAGSRRNRQPLKKASDAMRQPRHAQEKIRASATDGGGTVGWPTRACCCSAPPQVKVLVPVGEGRTVDLYLCGHHYQASLGPLSVADATPVFRDRPSTVSSPRPV